MKIQWNKVTWYSKLAAVILGLLIFAGAFYLGREFGKLDVVTDLPKENIQNNLPATTKTFQSEKYGFEISYPKDFTIQETNDAGFFDEMDLFNVSLNAPKDYQKDTDFNVGRIDVSVSSSTVKCDNVNGSGMALTSIRNINGISFIYDSGQPFPDAAAGGQRGFYSMFATIHNNQCYRIKETIGYRDLRGFKDPPYPQHYNETLVNSDMDKIISSFKFTK